MKSESRLLSILQTQNVSVVVPLFNEADVVPHLRARLFPAIEGLSGLGRVEVIFVDDGSTDGTGDLIETAFHDFPGTGVCVLRHDKNRGLGDAISTGFRAARGDVICVIDADCTYDPQELLTLIDRLFGEEADIVTASPYHPDGCVEGCPAWRIALSKAANRMYRVLSPVKLHCYTAMFRVYRKAWANPDLHQSAGFVAVAEELLTAAQAGARIIEHPATLHSRAYGVSKMGTVSATLSHAHLIVRTLVGRGKKVSPPAIEVHESQDRPYADRGFRAGMRTVRSVQSTSDVRMQ